MLSQNCDKRAVMTYTAFCVEVLLSHLPSAKRPGLIRNPSKLLPQAKRMEYPDIPSFIKKINAEVEEPPKILDRKRPSLDELIPVQPVPDIKSSVKRKLAAYQSASTLLGETADLSNKIVSPSIEMETKALKRLSGSAENPPMPLHLDLKYEQFASYKSPEVEAVEPPVEVTRQLSTPTKSVAPSNENSSLSNSKSRNEVLSADSIKEPLIPLANISEPNGTKSPPKKEALLPIEENILDGLSDETYNMLVESVNAISSASAAFTTDVRSRGSVEEIRGVDTLKPFLATIVRELSILYQLIPSEQKKVELASETKSVITSGYQLRASFAYGNDSEVRGALQTFVAHINLYLRFLRYLAGESS